MHDRALSPRGDIVGISASIAVTIALLAVALTVGLVSVIFVLAVVTAVVLGMANVKVFSVALLVTAPFPSISALVGVNKYVGLEPVDVLVVLALGVALHQGRRFPLATHRLLISLVTLWFGLLFIAWLRTYGDEPLTGPTMALFIHPFIVFLTGILAVQLIERKDVLTTVGAAMAISLIALGISVIIERIGLYHPPIEASSDPVGVKRNGGFMLQGNEAGALFAAYAVPSFILLHAAGRRFLASAVLVFSIPVLLITLARSSMIVFAASILAFAALDRRLESKRAALGVLILSTVWAFTGGRSQVTELIDQFNAAGTTSARLSGRPRIWNQVFEFLNSTQDRWLLGGGLNSFEKYAFTGPLQYAFTTHNTFLWLVTNGGLILVAAYVFLFVGLWRLAKAARNPAGLALRISLIATVILGLSKDMDLFGRWSTWTWALAAAAAALAREPAGAVEQLGTLYPPALKPARVPAPTPPPT